MQLSGVVANAAPGLQGFDCNSVVSAQAAKLFKAGGFTFCVRYLTRDQPQDVNRDLSPREAQGILDGGLALMAVQHVAPEGWSPSSALGTTYGQFARENAQIVGLPPGINLWLDLEGVNHATSAQDVIGYCNAWFGVVGAAGYIPGLYVGSNAVLSGDDLYWRLQTKHYWRSGSQVPDIPYRGYQLSQRIVNGDVVNGIAIDRDVTQTDAFGGSAIWLVANSG